MTAPDPEPLDLCWPIDEECLTDAWDDLSDTIKARAIGLASATLRRLTLWRVGGCPVKVRPCPTPPPLEAAWGARLGSPGGGFPWFPYQLPDGGIANYVCGTDGGCVPTASFKLPGYVGPISEIKVDGVSLDLSSVKVWDDNIVVWTGSGNPFPANQNMDKPDTEVGTFSVTYLPARPVDAAGAYACAVLAQEFGKACAGKTCRIPSNVTDIVRQGVTMTKVGELFPNGNTGVKEVDAWISIWNPNGLKSAPTVWSPDMPQVRVERSAT